MLGQSAVAPHYNTFRVVRLIGETLSLLYVAPAISNLSEEASSQDVEVDGWID